MDPESALEELTRYMNEMRDFCKKKKLNEDIFIKYSFMLHYLPEGIYEKETIEELDHYPEFWDYLILDYKFDNINVRKMFINERKDLPKEIRDTIINMKSIRDLFIVEEINVKENEIILRRPYSNEKYHVWTKALLDTLEVKDAIFVRLIFWREYIFAWGSCEIYPREIGKIILAHEKFLKELEKDINAFLTIEERRLSKRTARQRNLCLWTFYHFIYENPEINNYRRFRRTLVKNFLRFLRDQLRIGRSTIESCITSIRKFFQYLIEQGKLTNNSAEGIFII